MTLKAELDALRAELAQLRNSASHGPAEPPGDAIGHETGDLNALVHQMLEDAEEMITRHPAATVAGALALGIVIGRLTSR